MRVDWERTGNGVGDGTAGNQEQRQPSSSWPGLTKVNLNTVTQKSVNPNLRWEHIKNSRLLLKYTCIQENIRNNNNF